LSGFPLKGFFYEVYMMFWIIVLLVLGLLLIIKGGDWFVDAASRIAEISGIPQFIIGATIVSLGTTLPELLTSAIAAAKGQAAMAVGNAVGSVNSNIALIMAISLVCMPHDIERKDYVFKGITMVIAVAILYLLCIGGTLNAWLSLILLLVFAAFLAENIVAGKKQQLRPSEPSAIENDVDTAEKTKIYVKRNIIKNIVMFIIGATCIVFGADLLVDNGCALAARIGIPESVIAVTIVAVGTSLPELVTTVTAIVKKKARAFYRQHYRRKHH
jgi:Ca2+/Na+ antiporter